MGNVGPLGIPQRDKPGKAVETIHATNVLPVKRQEATVKSILLEVAGIKITISYERKARK